MSVSSALFTAFNRLAFLNRIKLSVVVHKINVMMIKTIAITIQMFGEQNARPFCTTQLCTDEHKYSLHDFCSSNGCSSLLLFWAVKVTFDDLLNSFPLMLFDATHW